MGIVGLIFYSEIKSKFTPGAVIIGFIAGGLLLLVVEKIHGNRKFRVESLDSITPVQAFKVGLLQILAVWPVCQEVHLQ